MTMFRTIDISTSALTAEKTRIDIISKNMANMNTTRTAGGEPYRKQIPIFKEIEGRDNRGFNFVLQEKYSRLRGETPGGVKLVKLEEDQTDFKLRYEPGHPDADENGYVRYPNVNSITELVDLISAQRSYDANVTSINSSKSMLMKALDIGRR